MNRSYILDIQFFAEEVAAEEVAAEEERDVEEKRFTQSDMDACIKKRLLKERNKWQKELEESKAEERRLATMDAEERSKAEAEKREKALSEREAKIKEAEDRLECEGVLKERGLDPSFSRFLIGADSDITLNNINTFEKSFKEAIKKEVDDRLKGKTPEALHGEEKPSIVSKEDFKKLSLFEQNKLYSKDPDIYREYYKN